MPLLQFDPMGTLQANRFTNELHTISAINGVDHNYIVPKHAPFFAQSMVVVDSLTGLALEENKDYYFGYPFNEATEKTGHPIYGAVIFIDPNKEGNSYLTYQSLGGPYVDDTTMAIEDGLEVLDNVLYPDWTDIVDRITNLPETFPPTPHTTRLDEVEGVAALVAKLEEMTLAITDTPRRITLEDVSDLEENYTQPLLAAMEAIAAEVSKIKGGSNYYYGSGNTSAFTRSFDTPLPESWLTVNETKVVIPADGVYLITVSSNANVEDNSGRFYPAWCRFHINDTAINESTLSTAVVGLKAGDEVSLAVASPYSGMEKLHYGGPTDGVGLTVLKMGE